MSNKKRMNRRYKNLNRKTIKTEFRKTGAKIADFYCDSETMKDCEILVAYWAHQHGDADVLHMYFYAVIATYITAIASQNKLPLVHGEKPSPTAFGAAFVIDTIADAIYRTRKNYLGLLSDDFDENDFSFEIATTKCVDPIDTDAVKSIMERIEHKVTASLADLELDKTEVIVVPWGTVVDRFTYYKILDRVVRCMYAEKFLEVQGFVFWTVAVACYDVANRIYKKYTEEMKE